MSSDDELIRRGDVLQALAKSGLRDDDLACELVTALPSLAPSPLDLAARELAESVDRRTRALAECSILDCGGAPDYCEACDAATFGYLAPLARYREIREGEK